MRRWHTTRAACALSRNPAVFRALCRTLWKSCSGFGDRRRSFAQKSSAPAPFAIAVRSDSGEPFGSRESVHAACQRPRLRRFTIGAAPRQLHAAGPVRCGGQRCHRKRAGKAEHPGPPKRNATPEEDLVPPRVGPCRTPVRLRVSTRSGPATGRGPTGSFKRVKRPGGGRQIGRTTTAESVGRKRNTRRALATNFLGRQPAGDGAFGPVPGSASETAVAIKTAGITPPCSRCGRWHRRGRSGARPRSHAVLRPACRRAT